MENKLSGGAPGASKARQLIAWHGGVPMSAWTDDKAVTDAMVRRNLEAVADSVGASLPKDAEVKVDPMGGAWAIVRTDNTIGFATNRDFELTGMPVPDGEPPFMMVRAEAQAVVTHQ